jgi:Zn-dependent protease with chaperone function
LTCYRLFLFNRSLYAAFGIHSSASLVEKAASAIGLGGKGSRGLPVIIGFQLASSLLSPLETLLTFALHALSRRLEFRADRFAQGLGYQDSLARGLATLMSENKGITDHDECVPPLSSVTMSRRLRAQAVQRAASLASDRAGAHRSALGGAEEGQLRGRAVLRSHRRETTTELQTRVETTKTTRKRDPLDLSPSAWPFLLYI